MPSTRGRSQHAVDAARNILVATDVPSDVESIESILSEEFGSISVSATEETAVEDFERCRPRVLVLAFKDLEGAERYYLGLYRLSPMIHTHPHQTVILCRRREMERVYQLCRKQYFNDFILYWPLVHEARYRLLMAVHYALRWLDVEEPRGPAAADFARQARRIAEFESVVERVIAQGGRSIGAASRSLEETQIGIEAALDHLAAKLVEGGAARVPEAGAELERELEHIRAAEIDERLRSATAVLEPVARWARGLRRDFEPQLDCARALGVLAEQVRTAVLVADDDAAEREAVGDVLEEQGIEVLYAESGIGALRLARAHRPDVILMDVQMPELDGIAALRALKSGEALASIPVIMMSGESDRELVVACREAGASGFLVRPYERGTLLRKVRSALQPDPGSGGCGPRARSGG